MKTFFLHNLKRSTGFLTKSLVLIIIITVVLLLPLKIPVSVSGIGKIFPASKWILSRENDGQLVTNLINYKDGFNDSYSVRQFAREGTMRFQLDSTFFDCRTVYAGDTIGSIYSSETEEQLTDLEAQLAIAEAALNAGRAGEKESLVMEANKNLDYARSEATQQQSIFARMKELRAKDLVSQEEYELVENDTELKNLQVEIAEARLKTAKSGQSPEEIELLKANILAIQKQIAVLNKRKESFSLVSPIKGVVTNTHSPDTLLIISDTSEYIAVIPIRRSDRFYLAVGQCAQLESSEGLELIPGEIVEIDNNVVFINGQETILAVARLTAPSNVPLHGLLINCRIKCNPITPLQYLKKFLNSLMV